MTRNTKIAIFALLLTSLLTPVLTKPVQKTPVKVGCQKAAVICLAKVTGHEYLSLPENKEVEVHPFSLWREYSVTKILKNNAGLKWFKAGQKLQINNKSNSCLVWKVTAKRVKDAVTLTHYKDPAKPTTETVNLVELRAKLSQEVILFLSPTKVLDTRPNRHQFSHYGWFLSGSKWTPKIKAEVQKHLK